MKKLFKKIKGAVLPAMLLCLLLTGCGSIKYETREEILNCLVKKGYIGKEDSLEYNKTGMDEGGLFPVVRYYDYMYCNESGELYNIRIYPSHDEDEEEYDVEIFYDIEIEENIVKSGDSEYTDVIMSDYAYGQKLQVERRSLFIFKWLAVTED